MAYSKQELQAITKRAQAALDKEFGPGVVSYAGGLYGDKMIAKFQFVPGGNAQKDAEKSAKDEARKAAWVKHHKELNPSFTEAHLGAVITIGRKRFTIMGLDFKRPTQSVVLKMINDPKPTREWFDNHNSVAIALGVGVPAKGSVHFVP